MPAYSWGRYCGHRSGVGAFGCSDGDLSDGSVLLRGDVWQKLVKVHCGLRGSEV